VVSASFDYSKNPNLLADFFWCLAHLNDVDQGWDSSVSLATPKESAMFVDGIREFLHETCIHMRNLPHAERTVENAETYPTWKTRVTNQGPRMTTDLIVKVPFARDLSMLDRRTRGSLAYDLTERRLVFMKDQWRLIDYTSISEYEVYELMREYNVPHVPRMLYGGDVLGSDGTVQSIMTQLPTDEESEHQWFPPGAPWISKLVQHCIVEEIAYPLKMAANEKELICAIYHALLGENHSRSTLNAFLSDTIVQR
jgi:hypothetical protein